VGNPPQNVLIQEVMKLQFPRWYEAWMDQEPTSYYYYYEND